MLDTEQTRQAVHSSLSACLLKELDLWLGSIFHIAFSDLHSSSAYIDSGSDLYLMPATFNSRNDAPDGKDVSIIAD